MSPSSLPYSFASCMDWKTKIIPSKNPFLPSDPLKPQPFFREPKSYREASVRPCLSSLLLEETCRSPERKQWTGRRRKWSGKGTDMTNTYLCQRDSEFRSFPLSHLILTTALRSGNYYYPQFTDGETAFWGFQRFAHNHKSSELPLIANHNLPKNNRLFF